MHLILKFKKISQHFFSLQQIIQKFISSHKFLWFFFSLMFKCLKLAILCLMDLQMLLAFLCFFFSIIFFYFFVSSGLPVIISVARSTYYNVARINSGISQSFFVGKSFLYFSPVYFFYIYKRLWGACGSHPVL